MTEITNGELMKVLLEIKGDVGEVKGEVSALSNSVGDEKIRSRTSEMAHDERLRNVENKVHGWSFGFGLLGVALGYLGFHIKV